MSRRSSKKVFPQVHNLDREMEWPKSTMQMAEKATAVQSTTNGVPIDMSGKDHEKHSPPDCRVPQHDANALKGQFHELAPRDWRRTPSSEMVDFQSA